MKRKFTDIMCWRWCGREESPQALGSAGGYPLNCHQATGMMGERTRPRLLHERYKRIQMYVKGGIVFYLWEADACEKRLDWPKYCS